MRYLVKNKTSFLVMMTLAMCAPAPGQNSAESRGPAGLMCELLDRPEVAAITDRLPEFSWVLSAPERGERQVAYRIVVARSAEKARQGRGDVWDSKRVASDRSVAVEYGGDPLAPGTYWWAVKYWSMADEPFESGWSPPQRFHLVEPEGERGFPTESHWRKIPTGEEEGWALENRHPIELNPRAPVSKQPLAKGGLFLDFGKAAFATLEIQIDPEALKKIDTHNRTMEIHLGEKKKGYRVVDREPGGTIRYKRVFVKLEKGRETYRVNLPPFLPPFPGGIRTPAHLGEVLPFRYAELIPPQGVPAQAITARQLAMFYDFDEKAARFHSSSQTLNEVWDLCKYTIKATSFLGVYIDGDRERLPYEADAYINQLAHYCVDREYAMARYSHEHLMYHPTWPTEWIPHSVLMAWADYMYTGDTESLEVYYEDLKAKTLIALAREDGLVSTRLGKLTPEFLKTIHIGRELRDIVDWPRGERDGYDFRDINTVVNAFHYAALDRMAKIADALGKPQDQEFFSERAQNVRSRMMSVLYDTDRGVYLDGEGSEHASLHANMFPLAFGLADRYMEKSILSHIKSKGMACSVYGAQYLLDAVYDAGADEYGLNLMTDTTTDRSWPHMIDNVQTTIALEAWDIKYKPNLDWNHAWGAAPANIIPRKLMGVEPIEPGFRKVRIKPQIGNLSFATLTHPTVRGPIDVEVRNEPDAYTLSVSIPGNTEAESYLPVKKQEQVQEDGRPIKGRNDIRPVVMIDEQWSAVRVGAGSYQFTVRR